MSVPDPDDPADATKIGASGDTPASRDTPGGPYFGRLLVVLFLAVAFCAFMTWLLSTFVTD